MAAKRCLIAFLFLSVSGISHGAEVVENEVEVCDENEAYSAEVCSKYASITYPSDNRNPKPKWILEPIPTMKRMFLRRMRKGGSTTVEKFVQKARQVHQKLSLSPAETLKLNAESEPTAFIGYDAMEYESLNMQCLFGSSAILGPSSNAILVTHFRYPIARINSEYWSEGPGHRLKMADESTWREWMAATSRRHQTVGVGYEPGLYTDNYYSRLLTGNCGDCHLRTVKKPHPSDIGMAQGCKATSDYYKYHPMNMSLLCKAIEVADMFHIVVIMEYYTKPSMNIWLRREMEKLMHLPSGALNELSLGHERNHLKDAPVPTPAHRTSPPPEVIEDLKADNKYDIQLYEWAKTKVDGLIAQYE